MSFHDSQIWFDFWENFLLSSPKNQYRDIIVDRKSHYSVTAFQVDSFEAVKLCFLELKKEEYFRKATHNSYAYRLRQENGSVLEGKNDDGEQWAGMCILRELQRVNAIDTMLIVTRYFGGIQLHTDRFKNVIDACKIFFEKEKK